MLHPDILLQIVKQRQGELWAEAAHAARVRQLKATRKRPSHDHAYTPAVPLPVLGRWHTALQELSPSRSSERKVA